MGERSSPAAGDFGRCRVGPARLAARRAAGPEGVLTVSENRGSTKPARFAVPRLPPGNVVRQRSLTLLDAASAAPLVLVMAGAGWGKTALLCSWAERVPAAWVTLEPELGNRRTFWRAFTLALTQAGAPELPPVPANGGLEAYPLELAEALAALEQPVRLLLDEFEHVHDDAVAGDLEQLIHHTGDQLSVVIASRVEPPFRLQRLRLSGLLAELRPSELAFTPEESKALFEQHSVSLLKPEVERLWRRTEGWPAGLGLAALALRGKAGPLTATLALTSAEHDLRAYVLKEIVERQPPERLALLLRTSILTSVDEQLANQLAGTSDGAQLLSELVREGFLVEDGGNDAYRVHPLLLDVLRTEAARRLPDELPELHRRTARVLATRGQIYAAIRHAIAGADWDHAAALLGEHWLSLTMQGGSAQLIELVDQVPTEVMRSDAELALAAAGLALETGDDRRATELLQLATRLAPALPEERRLRAQVTSVAVDLYRARSAGDVEQSLQAARSSLSGRWYEHVGEDLRALDVRQPRRIGVLDRGVRRGRIAPGAGRRARRSPWERLPAVRRPELRGRGRPLAADGSRMFIAARSPSRSWPGSAAGWRSPMGRSPT